MPYRVPTLNQSAAELKRQVEIERDGRPFLVYRDGAGRQHVLPLAGRERLVIGRGEGADLAVGDDDLVSRLHAEIEFVGGAWVVADDGLSSNGTFIDGERLRSRRRLCDRDLIVVGGTGILFRDPAASRAPAATRPAGGGASPPSLGDVQRSVLVALCRPLLAGDSHLTPATNAEIGAELHMSIGAVKANLRVLFEKFGVDGLAQNRKRAALADEAVRRGVVHPGDAG